MFKRIFGVFVAATVLFTVAAAVFSCKKKPKEELGYGAEMVKSMIPVGKTGGEVKMPILYDKRYFAVPKFEEPDEPIDPHLEIVAKYFYAVQHNDLEMFRELNVPFYSEYLQSLLKTEEFTDADWLQSYYTNGVEIGGENFSFFEIEITEYDKPEILSVADDVANFEITYNIDHGISERTISTDNTHAFTIEARINDKYLEAHLLVSKIGDGYKVTGVN